MAPDDAAMARLALEAAAAVGLGGDVTKLAAGQSSQAWLVGDHSVVRIPIPNSGRLLSYRAEKVLADQLHAAGVDRVATWELVEVQGALCSVGRALPGRPIDYEEPWTDALASDLATTLHALHSVPATGFGPLADADGPMHATSASRHGGIVDRWFHASIWPFDGTAFDQHVIHDVAPDLAPWAERNQQQLLGAEAGPIGIVHSDLHREHVLVDDAGRLGGLLDFGDAFVGALAWDFALLHWYYGEDNTHRLADRYPHGDQLVGDGRTLALAVGLYKLAKSPSNTTVVTRLQRLAEN